MAETETTDELSALRRARQHARQVRLAGRDQPCPACGEDGVTPRHRTDLAMWEDRAVRAEAADGTDPLTGVTLAEARAHVEALTGHQAALPA